MNSVGMLWNLSAFDLANLPYHWDFAKRRWIVDRDFTVTNAVGQQLTIKAGFESDGYTGVYNPPDVLPAIVHDWIYERCRRLDDGTPITFEQANEWLRYLMCISKSWITRLLAWPYFAGVGMFAWYFWDQYKTFKVKLLFVPRTLRQ